MDHDPMWAGLATRFAGEVDELFAGWLTSDVVHVGSTSVPGLRAKPIIDLQAVAPDPAAALAAVDEKAAGVGWMFVPRELDQRAWRWLFVRVSPDASSRLAHLHLMPSGQDRWCDQLLFRDRLRSSRRLRAEYSQVKQLAAAEHPDDREAYGRAKKDFVLRVVAAG
ncbi:GrpB family protein [Actinomycetospora endophytica]|uniref:GrpB family protein n=1 Tax=Actinomycetospora endophytica TaxID=2291215 RepID=A0ABS8PFU5_9PSEU|nr:GrpB family protein [Actinomycetospora endophytica]MCD2195879.1 GrpB family protein [Actinomycetospora endophytica]